MMDKMRLIESPIFLILDIALVLYVAVIYSTICCGSKKTPQKKKTPGEPKKGADAQTKGNVAVGQVDQGLPPPAEGPRPPQQGGIAGTFDPNYQTLAGVGGEVFGEDKQRGGGGVPQVPVGEAPPPPPVGGAPPAPAGGGPQAPAAGGMAETYDPNYQTLAGMGGEIFGQDKKVAGIGGGGGGGGGGDDGGGAGPKAPINREEKAGTFDPNYQTLAGVGGEVFGQDKKQAAAGGGAGPVAPENKDVKAGTFDPNYQTLAGVGGDVFGADKKM